MCVVVMSSVNVVWTTLKHHAAIANVCPVCRDEECPLIKVNCQYCDAKREHYFIEGQHKEECPKLSLPCPNRCEVGSVSREDMEAHRRGCPLEIIQCEYHNVGCEVKIARKDQERHENEKMKNIWSKLCMS